MIVLRGNFVQARQRLLWLLPGNYHLMFPSLFVGLILGTINPLTLALLLKVSRFSYSIVNLEKMNLLLITKRCLLPHSAPNT